MDQDVFIWEGDLSLDFRLKIVESTDRYMNIYVDTVII